MKKIVLWIGLILFMSCSDLFINEECESNLDCDIDEVCENGECENSIESNGIDEELDDDEDDDSDDDDADDDSDENEYEQMNSENGEMESHYLGQNCMNCHTIGETVEGIFTTAGSVYQTDLITSYPNLTINLYSEINGGGELIKIINGDGLGNFYSTDSIEFGSGVYPAITDGSSIKYMPQLTTSGSCNSCHNNTITSKIFFP
ncbi:MAG: hypothetical protein H8E72_04925 [Candidatus Marinimicrobia bacterium]|nr:hypothetical protein [Candidatus Neomarinimicrobiota bacterium]